MRAVNTPRLRTVLVAACLAVAATTSACGSEEKVTFAPNEGTYVDIGSTAYQVQISRALNPKSPEDPSYLVGLPAAQKRPLAPGEEWFAVFLRAQNYGDKPQTLANKFRIFDTEGKSWTPVTLSSDNQFAWNPTEALVPDYIYPAPSAIAGSGPVRQGSLLLFRINDSVYQNRPLILEIFDPADPTKVAARVSLDL